jgi:tetratricopeptide (TPR) repeat protein
LTTAIGQKADGHFYLVRARAREAAGDPKGAAADRAEGLAREPVDDAGWVARAETRVGTDPAAALADLDQALAMNPRSLTALTNKAHVLADRLGKPADAVAVLDAAVALYPEYGLARAERGVLRARLGDRDGALRDARAAVGAENSPAIRFQAACTFALTSRTYPGDRAEAINHLKAALDRGYGYDSLRTDHDLDPLRADPAFRQLLTAAVMIRPPTPDDRRGADTGSRTQP